MQGWQSALHAPRVFHTATVLHSGFVLIHAGVAGDDPVGVFDTSTSELYDPGLNETVASNVSAVPRFWHTGTSLPDGSVLMAGGRQLYLDSGLDCLLFNPSTQ